MSFIINGALRLNRLSGALALLLSPFHAVSGSTPDVMRSTALSPADLSSVDMKLENLSHYFVSEKLDGIRAQWNGENLQTRRGNLIHAPGWFTANFPKNRSFEGELWLGRDQFQALSKIVLDDVPSDELWRKVTFHVFDSSSIKGPFKIRYQALSQQIPTLESPYIHVILQQQIASLDALLKLLDEVEKQGGEGLMLQHQANDYRSGKTDGFFKLKNYHDSEATVIGYVEGEGKYTGKLGSVWVLTANNIKFKIGSGFSDAERESPPPLGSIIQFRHNGFTDSGIPRFARYIRMRPTPDI
ncbi:DNA ligase [Photobacterium minamisatsumaniensis]|uniref:DNA ligase n=1 Tax=Photobacterium minamisatsumaniensis TaxID=2910233 RepID=UPI003D0E86F5